MTAHFVFIFVQLRHLVHVAYCCGSKRGILYLTTSCMWPGFCCSSSPLALLRLSSFTAWSLKTSSPFSGYFRLVCHSYRMCSSHSHSRYEQTGFRMAQILLRIREAEKNTVIQRPDNSPSPTASTVLYWPNEMSMRYIESKKQPNVHTQDSQKQTW